MPQSALTPAEICSSFCLSRSIGLDAGDVWARAGRTKNSAKAALRDWSLIVFTTKDAGSTKAEDSTISVFLCGVGGFPAKKDSPDHEHHGQREGRPTLAHGNGRIQDAWGNGIPASVVRLLTRPL